MWVQKKGPLAQNWESGVASEKGVVDKDIFLYTS
jgi:hypothetical protein